MKTVAFTINAAAMLAILAGGGAMSLYVMATGDVRTAMFRPYPGYDYVNGRLTTEIEGSYEKDLPIRERSVNVLNAVTLALFEEGRKGVVVGNKGWLFSAEEYDWTPRSRANLEANIRTIAAAADLLRSKGIFLEIALVPEKADIYAALLRRPRPAEHAGKYEEIRAALARESSALVPDLRSVMLAGTSRDEMFFPTDTHWSVAGAGLAAKALADALPHLRPVAETPFALSAKPPVHYEGDLLNFLELGPFSALLPRTDDSVVSLTAHVQSAGVDDLLGGGDGAAPDIALVGTSYSANPVWSFEPQLKAALGRDVLNLAEVGKGPFVPMRDYLKTLANGSAPPKLLIWEIPVRYLDDDPKIAIETAI